MSESIGFIGIGTMGRPMATSLLKAGYTVKAYNRDEQKTEPLVKAGAQKAERPRDTVQPGGIVISMVANDDALEQVTLGPDGVLTTLGPGGIHISMSTISPALAQRLTELHTQQRSTFVSAPVFGRPEAAAAQKLWIALAGEPSARERIRPVLESLGQSIFEFGDEPFKANVVKISGNFLIAAAMEAMGEIFVLAEKNDISRRTLIDMFSQTMFASPIYKNYGTKIAERNFDEVGFLLKLGLKDIDLIQAHAKESAAPMPIASLLHDRLLSGVAKGRGERDWMELTRGIDEDAGLSEK